MRSSDSGLLDIGLPEGGTWDCPASRANTLDKIKGLEEDVNALLKMVSRIRFSARLSLISNHDLLSYAIQNRLGTAFYATTARRKPMA